MKRRLAVALAVVAGFLWIAHPASATPNQLIYTPGGHNGYVYAQSPAAGIICANTRSMDTTTSVRTSFTTGTPASVTDTTANGSAVCVSPAPHVDKVRARVNRNGRYSTCFREYEAVRSDPYSTVGDNFGTWRLVASASSGC